MQLGNVVKIYPDYGFIFSRDLNRRVFFHFSAFIGGKPKVGQLVSFKLAASGRPTFPDKAVDVCPVETIGTGVEALTSMKTEQIAGVEVSTTKVGA